MRTTKRFKGLLRQGDVLLVPVHDRPPSSSRDDAERSRGRLVLAQGEATGHAHVVSEPHAQLVERRVGRSVEILLFVEGAPATLTHQEHDPISVPPGAFRVVRQREYDPRRRFHRVAD